MAKILRSPPSEDIQKLNHLLIHSLDNLQGWGEIRKDLLKLKSAVLILQEWERWFQQGCGHEPPAEQVFQMIDELNFLLRECRDGLESELSQLESDLEKAHLLARPLACKCRSGRELCKL